MPTLNDLNVFSFDEKAVIPSNIKDVLKRLRAIEIIETIIKSKLDSPSSYRSRLYFVNSRTGSGKSTFMISYMFHKFGKIICSQPRIVLTKANAIDVIRYNDDMEFGKNVSILKGAEKIYAKERTSCTYCTTQILSDQLYKMMAKGRISKGYKIVVIDECHVLDSALLSLVSIVKRFLKKFSTDPRCPLFIFTSATIDVDMMVKFFFGDSGRHDSKNNGRNNEVNSGKNSSDTVNDIYKDPTMIAYVKGSPNFEVISKHIDPFKWIPKKHDTQDRHDDTAVTRYKDNNGKTFARQGKAPNTLAEAALSNYLLNNYIDKPQGDCLVFAPLKRTLITLGNMLYNGINDKHISFLVNNETSFEDVVKWRDRFRNQHRFLIIPYARDYSVAADRLLENATEPDEEARKYELKLIISTPVLETGKTFSNLALCVDYGIQTTAIYNPLFYNGIKLHCIKQIPANKRQVIQRRGRVGRERPGEFIYFYTEDTYDALPENEFPATINNYVLTEVMLKVITSQYEKHAVFDIMNLNDFLYDISYDIMLRTVHDMIRYGLYSIHGELLNDSIDKSLAYIEYYYYIRGHTLYESAMFTKIHLYDLPDELSKVYDAPALKIDMVTTPKQQLIESILYARNIVTKLIYDPSYNNFPIIRSRLI